MLKLCNQGYCYRSDPKKPAPLSSAGFSFDRVLSSVEADPFSELHKLILNPPKSALRHRSFVRLNTFFAEPQNPIVMSDLSQLPESEGQGSWLIPSKAAALGHPCPSRH